MQRPISQTRFVLQAIQRATCLLCLAAVLSCSQDPTPVAPPASPGHTYYVAADGSDRGSGLSPADPWKTVSKVNATFFEPGDHIYFRRGDTWREQLTVSSSGQRDRPIVVGAYGQGPRPRFAGTVATLPFRNAFRNPSLEEFTGVADDGLSDDFYHFFHGGGRVEAVSDTPAGGGDVALCLDAKGAGASIYAFVFLPANSRVKMRWQAKSTHSDGTVAIRHRLKGPAAVYLQDDLQTWDVQANWDAVAIAGDDDGIWRQRSVELITDDAAGAYQVYFAADGAATCIDTIELVTEWESEADHVYRLGTGYAPKRVLIRVGDQWSLALNGDDFGRSVGTLEDLMWFYDPADGMIHMRDDLDRIADAGTLLEISVPEADDQGECGVYVDQSHITLTKLSVVGWPDDNPAYRHAGGIAITESADRVTVTGCEVAFNYRSGLYSFAANGIFTDNLFAYNGGNGISFARKAHHNIVARNETMYNGYWGLSSDDGEGISLAEGTAENLVEANEIHHNNRHPQSSNPGGLAIFRSNRNIVRYNRIYRNYKGGAFIDGAENQIYYNLVFENGIGYADTNSPYMYNIMVRDYYLGAAGGNKVFNNVFYGGTSDTRWMANLFINRNCTDTEIRNNVFWGFVNDGYNNAQIRIDGNKQLTGTVLSHNIIGPEGSGFIHYDGKYYASLGEYRSATGQGEGSLSIDPAFVDPDNGDFRLLAVSALIDAGRYVGLVTDFDFRPVDALPDIGALEYHPF